jgi:hypothetical protein
VYIASSVLTMLYNTLSECGGTVNVFQFPFETLSGVMRVMDGSKYSPKMRDFQTRWNIVHGMNDYIEKKKSRCLFYRFPLPLSRRF